MSDLRLGCPADAFGRGSQAKWLSQEQR